MVFDNLVKFVYKLGKNWQTRAWDPVIKTAGSAPDAAMIPGLFSQKKPVKPEIVNRYDLLVLRHKIGGAKLFVNNVQWSDQMM